MDHLLLMLNVAVLHHFSRRMCSKADLIRYETRLANAVSPKVICVIKTANERK